jgi:hypothetical protein
MTRAELKFLRELPPKEAETVMAVARSLHAAMRGNAGVFSLRWKGHEALLRELDEWREVLKRHETRDRAIMASQVIKLASRAARLAMEVA